MRFINKLLFLNLILISVLFVQCKNDKVSSVNGTLISGDITGAENLNVILDKVALTNKVEMLSSIPADANGHFSVDLTNISPEPALYRMRIGAMQYYFVLNGDEKDIKFSGSLSDFNDFNVNITGSKDALELNEAMKKAKTGGFNEESALAFMEQSSNPIAGMWLFMQTVMPSESTVDAFKSAIGKMIVKAPKSEYTRDFTNYVAQLESAINKQNAVSRIQVGNPAPDLEFEGPDGKSFKLSSLKGKTVLLDFWASWCGPCRRENPSVVAVYDKYKSKGFTVFSVSLDKSKDKWLQAIEKDNLKWEYHVSDLQGWSSAPAGVYGVRSIPATFLIDKNGNIAATGLRGAASIEDNLKKIL